MRRVLLALGLLNILPILVPAVTPSQDLATLLLLNNNNNNNQGHTNPVPARFFSVRPEVGLLTSTARTFIQEGVTTEYTTRVLGTTLENGRVYAQYFKKGSRVLFEPSVVTSWVGESAKNTRSLLQSHNDLLDGEHLNEWKDIDDRLLLERNDFVGNTDYVGYHKLRLEKDDNVPNVANDANSSLLFAEASKLSAPSNFSTQDPVNNVEIYKSFENSPRKITADKVLPFGGLPTYTVKNVYSPSRFLDESDGTGGYGVDSADLKKDPLRSRDGLLKNGKRFGDIPPRSPRIYHQKFMEARNIQDGVGGVGTPEVTAKRQLTKQQSTVNSHHLSTITYYGFADFTTVVGDSVIVFSPSSSVSTTNYGLVTPIKGEATLGGEMSTNTRTYGIITQAVNVPEMSIVPTNIAGQQSSVITTTKTTTTTTTKESQSSSQKTPVGTTLADPDEFSMKETKDIKKEEEHKTEKEVAAVPITEATTTTTSETTESSVVSIQTVRTLPDEFSQTFDESVEATTKTLQPSSTQNGGLTTSLTTSTPVMLSRPSDEDILRIYASLASLEAAKQSELASSSSASVFNKADEDQMEETTKIQSDQEVESEPEDDFDDAQTSEANAHDDNTKALFAENSIDNFIESTEMRTSEIVTKSNDHAFVHESIAVAVDSQIRFEVPQGIVKYSTISVTDYNEMTDEGYHSILQTSEKYHSQADNLDSHVNTTSTVNTVSASTTVPPNQSNSKTSFSVETNQMPTPDIGQKVSKHYCGQSKNASNTDQPQDFSECDYKNDDEEEEVESSEKSVTEEDFGTTGADNIGEGASGEEARLKDAEGAADEMEVEERDDGSEEEYDVIYKTLYTTYTYLTTFFHDDTTSISSNKKVITNVMTSTLDPDIDIQGTILPEHLKTETQEPTTSSKFVIPPEIESILRSDNRRGLEERSRVADGEHNRTSEETPGVEDSHIAEENQVKKTYLTTYTYFTTLFSEGETEVLSTTEVHTNYLSSINTPSLSTVLRGVGESIRTSSEMSNDGMQRDVYASKLGAQINASESSQNANKFTAYALERPELSDYLSVSLSADIRSRSSNGNEIILSNENPDAVSLEDQISSESNTDEILPSATLLLQTSFTTFTYYTTMYGGQSTNILSHLEKVTNVVTETLQPTRAVNAEEATLPITYFTTFTYWTKLSKDGEISTISREETVSNVITPTSVPMIDEATVTSSPPAILSTSGEDLGELQTRNSDGPQMKTTEVTENVPVETIKPSLVDIQENNLVPTTFYTTYTYYTTLYNSDGATTNSRFETVTNIVTKPQSFPLDLSTSVAKIPSDGNNTSLSLSDNTKTETNTENKNLHDDVIVITSEGKTSPGVLSGNTSLYVDEEKKALIVMNTTETVAERDDGEHVATPAIDPSPIQSIQLTPSVSPMDEDAVQGSINDNVEDNDDDIDKQRGGHSPLQSRKNKFAPVIRPFASRNRPQFSPKKKNVTPSVATIITRSAFTPTITATLALKSTPRSSSSSFRRGGFPAGISSNGGPNVLLSRHFNRPTKATPSGSGVFGFATSSGSPRNPYASSARHNSPGRILSSSDFRGLSSGYTSNFRGRIRPTSTNANFRSSTISPDGSVNSENSEDDASDQEVLNEGGEDEPQPGNSRGNQNPLLRFKRPLTPNRPSPNLQSNQYRSGVTQRRNPLANRAKTTTHKTTTTTTTSRPRPRSFQRPVGFNVPNRSNLHPSNLFYPRRPFQTEQQQQQQPIEDVADSADKISNDDDEDFVDGTEDDSEYDDDEKDDEEGDAEDGNRRRRSTNEHAQWVNTSKSVYDDLHIVSGSKAHPEFRLNHHRNKREADTSHQARSNFRNRFRKPKSTSTTKSEINADEEIELSTAATTRGRTGPNARFSARYQGHNAHHTTSSTSSTGSFTSNHRAIHPTKPTTGRAPFTLREKDTTASNEKSLPRAGSRNFRRLKAASSPRRPSTSASTSNRRNSLKGYTNSNTVTESNGGRASSARTRNSGGNLSTSSRTRSTVRGRGSRNDYRTEPLLSIFDGTITVTHVIPSEITIPVINGQITEYKNVVTAKTSTEILDSQQYTTFLGTNGQFSTALKREDSSVNFAGATEITQYVLSESSTNTVIFTPTTIRGRKTSFSHIIPSTVYSVLNVVSTVQPQLNAVNANGPLANILLSQLLFGNIGLAGNPVLGAALGGAINLQTQQQQQQLLSPVTQYRTHTSTYVTTVYEGMSTVLPITFMGKKLITTIFDTSAQTITATEFITDTIVTTPTQQPVQADQVNSLLLQQLLLQQQPQQQQQPLPIINSKSIPNLSIPANLQELETDSTLGISNDANDIDDAPTTAETHAYKSGRKKNRKAGKGNKRHKMPPAVDKSSSVITIYVSGRRPGEFSTVLSTVPAGYDSASSTQYKRHAYQPRTRSIDTPDDFYVPDGSERVFEVVLPYYDTQSSPLPSDVLEFSERNNSFRNVSQLDHNILSYSESGEQDRDLHLYARA